MRRMVVSILVALSLWGMMGAAAEQPAAGSAGSPPDAAPPQAVKVLHLSIHGDLDSQKLARDFADALGSARAEGVEVVVLELSGNRWRADVVHTMARALRDPGPQGTAPGPGSGAAQAGPRRILALLDDPAEHRIGFGQASIALLADACTLTPRTCIVYDPADDLRSTAGPETDWERVDRELQGMVYLAAKDRQADVLLGSVLPTPAGPLWAWPGANARAPWVLGVNRPDGGQGVLMIPAAVEGRSGVVRLDARQAARLGIVNCEAKDVGQLLASQGMRARPVLRKELVSGLNDGRAKVERLMGLLDDGLRGVDIDLAQAAKLRGQEAPRQKREAGEKGKRSIAEAERRLLEAEGVMTEYPELLSDLPPGRTPVGQDAAKHSQLWRWKFQDMRDEIERLRASAESLSRTP